MADMPGVKSQEEPSVMVCRYNLRRSVNLADSDVINPSPVAR